MRYISIDHVKENDMAAADVQDPDGRIMVAKGATLTKSVITRLKRLGFRGLYIGDLISEDIEIPETISPKLRKLAKECIRTLDVEGSVKISHEIIKEILDKQIVALDMSDIRSFDDYTYAHSVNVAVLSCVIGVAMKIGEQDLLNLVNAAILHDFGKMKVPEEILNKTGRLTGSEYEIIKDHVSFSYDILKDHDEINDAVKEAVYSHHENEDGSGYPRGLTGDEIPLIAQIVHVADVYDALVSNRPYKMGYAPWEAVEYLMGGCGINFNREVVDKFTKLVPLYPIGGEVRLSTGDLCIVIGNKGNNNLRPIVRRVRDGALIDLSLRENLTTAIYAPDETYLQKSEEDRIDMVEAALHRRIVIVDDMKTNLQMLRDILEPNYKVIPFKSGGQVLKYLENHNTPDLLLLDIDMPIMMGTELAQIINEKYDYKIPILFVSSLTDKKTVMMCRELKASGYIARPYQAVYILSEIKRILSGQTEY